MIPALAPAARLIEFVRLVHGSERPPIEARHLPEVWRERQRRIARDALGLADPAPAANDDIC